MGKLAIKRLTASDLTIFEWQFRNRNSGNQKSINLNANIFIDQLFPALLETDVGRNGRVPLDLFLYGPGNARAWNLQRKIIKGGAYKNWRLNGEYIGNPLDHPDRFNVLVPDDFVIFEFEGELFPTGAHAVFVAQNVPEDTRLHAGIKDSGIDSMLAIDMAALRLIVHASGTPESHPVYELLLDSAFEDAAQSGLDGTLKILHRSNGRRITQSELERARQRTDYIGKLGEELLDDHFAQLLACNEIEAYTWVSADNAVAPYDFTVKPKGSVECKVEVKSTNGDFGQILHLSIAQLREMCNATEPYKIYRVYDLDRRAAKLRVATNVDVFARVILDGFDQLPQGVSVDSISIRPDALHFDSETAITFENDTEVEPN